MLIHPPVCHKYAGTKSLFIIIKDFLNSPPKIFFKMAAKLAKTTAILREKTPNPELRPLFRCNDWTRNIGNQKELNKQWPYSQYLIKDSISNNNLASH